MTAFNPISAQDAVELFDHAGLEDAAKVLADYSLAGRVKGYADWMEKLQPNGTRTEARNKKIEPEMWRRIIHEGKIGDIATGTIRLDGSSDFGGGPKWTIIGIRFHETGIRTVLAQQSGCGRPTTEPKPTKEREAVPPRGPDIYPKEECAAETPHLEPKRANPSAIPEGALLATIAQAQAALGLGRTKVNELMNSGRLIRREIDGGVRIEVKSIRAIAGMD